MQNKKGDYVQGLYVNEKKFSNGMIIKCSAKIDKLIPWLQSKVNEKGYCNFEIKWSNSGNIMAVEDTWKPDPNYRNNQPKQQYQQQQQYQQPQRPTANQIDSEVEVF